MNVFKQKSLLIKITFNQNQFYKINSIEIKFPKHTNKHT